MSPKWLKQKKIFSTSELINLYWRKTIKTIVMVKGSTFDLLENVCFHSFYFWLSMAADWLEPKFVTIDHFHYFGNVEAQWSSQLA